MGTLLNLANPHSGSAALGLRLQEGMQPMISPVTTAIGDVLAVDETVVVNGLYTTMKVVAAGDLTSMGLFGVSMAAIGAAAGTGQFLFIGYVPKVLMVAATVAGAEVTPTATLRSMTATATAQKVVAKVITATAGAGLTDAFFDGVNGFGCLA